MFCLMTLRLKSLSKVYFRRNPISQSIPQRGLQVLKLKCLRQYKVSYAVFYIVVGDDLTMCKIGLNPHQLTKWGRREATKHPERSYKLYRQHR